MKTQKRKLNVKLLRRIQRHILEEPRRFFMDWFIAKGTPGKRDFRVTGDTSRIGRDLAKIVPPCGTAACIAGWANIFTGHRPDSVGMARRELGLREDQANRLFTDYLWPEPFASIYGAAITPKQRAKVAAERIEHLIQTGE